jgi:hypothetical protein
MLYAPHGVKGSDDDHDEVEGGEFLRLNGYSDNLV